MSNIVFQINLRTIGVLCLSALFACVCEIVSLRAFKGEVGSCACYGMS